MKILSKPQGVYWISMNSRQIYIFCLRIMNRNEEHWNASDFRVFCATILLNFNLVLICACNSFLKLGGRVASIVAHHDELLTQ